MAGKTYVREAGSTHWMSRGACLQADPGLFFSVEAEAGGAARRAAAAKAVCRLCAVRDNCLSYALETRPEGIWGGTTAEERRTARRSAAHPAGQPVTSGRTA
jgi:WhiB family redox-sensing transcriptional regulator